MTSGISSGSSSVASRIKSSTVEESFSTLALRVLSRFRFNALACNSFKVFRMRCNELWTQFASIW